ncbi:hypothetical protein LTR70_006597 [Exophiala xenobiotica]|uniref:Uncharacterized protein n=1 Tax=Lithohypha guttulata TaxID=1690604 RepID=A0ABR0K7N8_9EURO|nr:hypothetical protein LTR24_005916 [Lithohypha guttulata]KAK5315855.1 hypothetical protein LTR70_006597 [Exophiala xenobiotica]
MLILTQDTYTTQIAALRLSEPARYDELMADVPDTLQLTYMGSMGSYEQMDFDLPAVSPDIYFRIDWDEPQSTAEIVVSKSQTNNDYTLPKLRYDPTAPGCATEDNFEEYVARRLLLPTKQKSKVFNLHPAIVAGIEPDEGLQRAGAQVANNLEILGSDNSPAVILSESELAESLMTGSPEYREASRSLPKHDPVLTKWVTAGSAFDLKRATIRQRLRSSSISSEYPSLLPDTGESWETMTAVTTTDWRSTGHRTIHHTDREPLGIVPTIPGRTITNPTAKFGSRAEIPQRGQCVPDRHSASQPPEGFSSHIITTSEPVDMASGTNSIGNQARSASPHVRSKRAHG